MSEPPPDPPRLRAMLAYLDRQIAENDTVGRYLRLQHEAVRKALTRAERPAPPPRRPSRSVKGLPAFRPALVRTGFVVQQKRTPTGPEPALVHLADCSMIEGTPHPVRAGEARAALTEPTIEPCAFCRPDTELGMDLA
ncbi:DUF6233 domain-containing protein [Streptomyces sp. NPDC088810]|uniref:DUF6233 domain-containing protein n=1 Tax=Streptomyces sp. NPDC088810 TaxID=3365904 RepID=UPI003800FA9F